MHVTYSFDLEHFSQLSSYFMYIHKIQNPKLLKVKSMIWFKMFQVNWNEIPYSFPNFNICTVEVWEWIRNFTPHFIQWM